MTFRSMLRNRLCNHNPFYLISAGLVLYGIHISFADRTSVADGWLLMRLLVGYTLLLLIAAAIVVKWAKVWEDARMILLVMVLTTVAISVGFDRFCLDRPAVGARFLGVGFVFVVLITELTLLLLRIRLLWWYRLPFYAQFGLIFAYPVMLAHLSVTDQEDLMFRMVFLFPWLAALSLMLLLPSAMLGSPDEQNGTPWKWPAYPWPLFVGMLVALGVRSYGLTVSFELERGLAFALGVSLFKGGVWSRFWHRILQMHQQRPE